ncbi:MAG: PHB depolymerase family esterase [Candidatus Thiodiazotropha sp.]
MTRIYLVFLSLLPFIGLMPGCSATTPKSAHAQSEQYTILHDGIKRTYSIYVPGGTGNSQAVPLLMALHGGGGSDKAWPRYTDYGFERLADSDKFILVYPNGVEGHWNDGRDVQHLHAQREPIDDSGFLARLIDELKRAYPIDSDRVFVTGASNGGMMAHRLAAEHAEKVAAIATVIASIPKNLQGKLHPSHPVSVLMINGTDDPLVRWEGGPVRFGRKSNGAVISTEQAVRFWVNHGNCSPTAETIDLPDAYPDDGTSITRIGYRNCKSGSEVVLYKIVGGGHTWPMQAERRRRIGGMLIDSLVGKRSREIDACDVIWEFFKKHPDRHEPSDD